LINIIVYTSLYYSNFSLIQGLLNMPTYDYKCRKCEKNFEYFQSISSEALERCPESVCEQEKKGEGEVFRKISKSAGVILKGGGFYETDYVKKTGSDSSAESKVSNKAEASA